MVIINGNEQKMDKVDEHSREQFILSNNDDILYEDNDEYIDDIDFEILHDEENVLDVSLDESLDESDDYYV